MSEYWTVTSIIFYAGDRIRTCVGTKPQPLKGCPFGHSGTPAYYKFENRILLKNLTKIKNGNKIGKFKYVL